MIKKGLSKFFIDGSAGYANGVFITLVLGTLLSQITSLSNGTIAGYLSVIASLMIAFTGAGIGAGISIKYGEQAIITLSAAISGLIGAHASELISGSIVTESGIALNGAGEPLGAFLAAYITIEIGHLIYKRAPMGIVVIPVVSILIGGIAGIVLATPINHLMAKYALMISWSMERSTLIMGALVAVLMGLAYVLPFSTALIGELAKINGVAAGAALAGICCQMIGFAVISYKDNKLSGVLAQGIGSPVLQLPNILKKPFIVFPTMISSAIMGMLTAGIFHTQCTLDGIGIGGTAFVGQIECYHATALAWGDTFMVKPVVVLLYVILPGVLTHYISKYFFKEGIIKGGDLKVGLK